jgi:hypothetical protein
MPVTYHIDLGREIVFSTATGRVTDAELWAHQDQLRADPRFRPHFRQLFEVRAVDQVEVTVEGVRRLAARNPFGAGAKRAAVADHAVVFGLARMFELLTDRTPDEMQVFTDMTEARQWLELDE